MEEGREEIRREMGWERNKGEEKKWEEAEKESSHHTCMMLC